MSSTFFIALRVMCFIVPTLALLMSGAAVVRAYAEYEPDECRYLISDRQTKEQYFAALSELDRCQSAFMGVLSIDQRAVAGQSVVRSYIQRGERSLPLFIEYVRAPDGRTWVDVRALAPDRPRMTATVREGAFSVVQTRWNRQAELSVAAKNLSDAAKGQERAPGIKTVCIPRWAATVETAQAGRVTRVELDSCNEREFQFVHFIVSRALHDVGDCSSERTASTDDDRLLSCLSKKHGAGQGYNRNP